MIERTEEGFDIKPNWLAADTAYGSAPNLDWLVNDKDIAPYIAVIDKSKRTDGTFSREDFIYDTGRSSYTCPAGKTLTTTGKLVNGGATRLYMASTYDCGPCPLNSRCCPKSPQRKVPRDVNEAARDVARALAKTQAYAQTRRDRKKVEMLFAHLKRILRLAGCGSAGQEEHSSSSPSPRSLKICDGSPNWPFTRRTSRQSALCERPVAFRLRQSLSVKALMPPLLVESQRQDAARQGSQKPNRAAKRPLTADFCNEIGNSTKSLSRYSRRRSIRRSSGARIRWQDLLFGLLKCAEAISRSWP